MHFDDVSVVFGGLHALSGVNFSVSHGEIVGLIGPNGAGKTTAFNAACGFVPPTSGAVTFPGLGRGPLTPHDLADAGVARTLQGVGLFPHLTVLENVIAGGHVRPGGGLLQGIFGFPRGSKAERALRTEALANLERLDVAHVAGQLPGAIPYGTAKKVAVARALMQSPKLLLLDEPASGLDERELEEFSALIGELRQDMGVLLVEHNMDFVMELVDRLVVLNFGKVIAEGTPGVVRQNEDVLAAYLGVDE
jgi:branched-chain amino acid transport system ATP-binding protein